MTDTAPDLTPAMRQFQAVKAKYPDCIVFFRIGDFYEIFYEDAKTASRVLGIALTSRSKTENAVPMAGVPFHAVDGYLAKMLEAGFRVAVVEQLEDPRAAKGVIKRDVVRVITPGTLTDETLLTESRPNYLAAVFRQGDRAGLAWVELSTGAFAAQDLAATDLPEELARLAPAECLVPERPAARPTGRLTAEDLAAVAPPPQPSPPNGEGEGASAPPPPTRGEGEMRDRDGVPADSPFLITSRPDWVFAARQAETALCEQFATATLAGFGFPTMTLGLQAAGAIIEYLQQTQRTRMAHLRPVTPVRRDKSLLIDATSLRSLEIVRTLRSQESAGSLLAAIDRTKTAMGARLLRNWLLYPPAEAAPIVHRQRAVAELHGEPRLRRAIRDRLGEIGDIERMITRISCGRASPRDLLGLGRSLTALDPLRRELADPQSALLAELAAAFGADAGTTGLADITKLIASAVREDSPANLRDGGVIRDGFDPELDRLRDIARNGQEWIAKFQASEIARTGIPSLKVGFNSVFGYYIEITHTHRDKAPADYVRKQTVKNAERYITEELKQHESEVLTAEQRAQALEAELFERVRREIAARTPAVQAAAAALAQLDVLSGFAELAEQRRYVRPEIVEEPILDIADGRHPVLDQTLDGKFVPNDVKMDERDCRTIVITGPNMAGKSTYIRQTAALTLLAHTGSFIPASRAVVGLCDRIFARVGASDELARGQSTFMVEMTETANILHNATRRSLVILDEIGRGTSTFDGLSLAWAIAEHIVRVVGCRTLFATHYHELTELASAMVGIANYNVSVREWQDEIVFLHRIVAGGADKSYGLHVARLAGVPTDVISRAREVLRELEGVARRADARGSEASAPAGSGSGARAADAAAPPAAADGATGRDRRGKLPPSSVRRLARTAGRRDREQLLLFEDLPHPLLEKLRSLDPERLSPDAAVELLRQLRREVQG